MYRRSIPEVRPEGGETRGPLYIVKAQTERGTHVRIWSGKQGRPFHNVIYRPQHSHMIEPDVARFVASHEAHEKMKADAKAKRSAPHAIEVGAVILNSWGYDQTNADFYQVVAVTPHSVKLRRIASQEAPRQEGGSPMSAMVVAVRDSFTSDEIITKQARADGYVNFKHGSGRVWDGRPTYSSWYA